MIRPLTTALACVLAVCGCSPLADHAESYTTLLGVSAPEQATGFVAFWVNRWEDRDRGVVFNYSPPLDSGPMVSMSVYPVPDTASATHLRHSLDAELDQWARPLGAMEPPEIDPSEAVTIVGSDGVSYQGWQSRVARPGTRLLSYLYVFEKQGHVIRYVFRDDNLDPALPETVRPDFIAVTIGGLRFQEVPADPESASRPASAERTPDPPWIGPDSLLSGEELERVYDVREAALRWAFENAETDLDPPAVYCIAQGAPDADASDRFLDRFADSEVPVRGFSACELLQSDPDRDWRATTRHSIVDRATGAFGLMFHLGRLAWTGSSSAQVEILYLQGNLWGKGWRCTAESSQPGEWEITECRGTVDI